jgi:hypothetical protein
MTPMMCHFDVKKFLADIGETRKIIRLRKKKRIYGQGTPKLQPFGDGDISEAPHQRPFNQDSDLPLQPVSGFRSYIPDTTQSGGDGLPFFGRPAVIHGENVLSFVNCKLR